MIKNISVSIKLWLIVLPAILALGGLLFLFIIRSNDIEEQSKTVLYDENVRLDGAHSERRQGLLSGGRRREGPACRQADGG